MERGAGEARGHHKKLTALLAYSADEECGEVAPEASPDDQRAIAVGAFLANGMGGYDWGSLPLAVEFFHVEDVEGLIQRLFVMKTYTKPEEVH